MDNNASRLIELSSRISSITKEITAEEQKYSKALSENSSPENLRVIKDQLQFLKRKYALYTQAEQMRSGQSS